MWPRWLQVSAAAMTISSASPFAPASTPPPHQAGRPVAGSAATEPPGHARETDDPALIARDVSIFSAFFDMNVYPVLDIEEAARIGGAAVEFRQSV
jgi:hypothetical protein